MTEKSNTDRFAFIEGQLYALVNVVNSLIAIHPDLPLASRALQAAEQASEARIVPSNAPEATLRGAREVHAKMAEAISRFRESD